ncbi:hypothetical protein GCM10025768_24180 [Microbacterium pseudoresistens]|uniref:histidine kinase n=1 Tax=Microbacterium pseudoresistens TaxID=640634 RepID=A0A7Y9JP94_9MICO|nr:sensor histidine kinase [Microbacterium pseudoresistens]NYD55373.1 signal transduction histidine kinase [Microbacterium pseudoresistens]
MRAKKVRSRKEGPEKERPTKALQHTLSRIRRILPRGRTNALILILSLVAVVLYSVLVPIHTTAYGSPVAVTMALALAAVVAPLVSVRHPNLAIILFTASAVLIPLMISRAAAPSAPWPWSVPMLLAFAVVVAAITFRHGWRPGLVQFGLGSAAGVTAAIMLPSIPSGNSLIVTTSVIGGVYLVAVLLAGRLRLGDELTRERAHTAQEQSRRVLVEERSRIARDLHDIVAHSMSLIQVQASTARYRVEGLSPAAIAEFDDIAGTARTALVEMRRLLGVLRTEDQAAELAPQQGLDDIPALVETVRRAGADVELAQRGDAKASDISQTVQISAFRIVQEALSNAVRHAPGAPVRVSLVRDPDAVRIEVRNGAGTAPSSTGAGHGLRGMRERVALLGGSLETGPDDSGGWTVNAVLPYDRGPDGSEEDG